MTKRYTVLFEAQSDGGYHAVCPTLPGCHSEGDTLEEATANVREAIEEYLESMIAHYSGKEPNDMVLVYLKWKEKEKNVTEPDGAANRSQPIRAETNRKSVAAGSDR